MFSEKGRASLAFPRTSPFLSNGFCSVGKGEPYFVFLQKWRLSVSLPLKERNVFKERGNAVLQTFLGLTGKAVKRDSIRSKVLGGERGSPSSEGIPFPLQSHSSSTTSNPASAICAEVTAPALRRRSLPSSMRSTSVEGKPPAGTGGSSRMPMTEAISSSSS